MTIEELRAEYLDLIIVQLPAAAAQGGYPVRFNHCFARIVLDALLEACWYDRLSRKTPAYKQLSEDQLEAAIGIARSVLESCEVCRELNRLSLGYRRTRQPLNSRLNPEQLAEKSPKRSSTQFP